MSRCQLSQAMELIGLIPLDWPSVTHRLFIPLAAVSLLLFVATVVMWVRSYFRADYVMHVNDYDVGIPVPFTIDGVADRQQRIDMRRPSWSRGNWNETWAI